MSVSAGSSHKIGLLLAPPENAITRLCDAKGESFRSNDFFYYFLILHETQWTFSDERISKGLVGAVTNPLHVDFQDLAAVPIACMEDKKGQSSLYDACSQTSRRVCTLRTWTGASPYFDVLNMKFRRISAMLLLLQFSTKGLDYDFSREKRIAIGKIEHLVSTTTM